MRIIPAILFILFLLWIVFMANRGETTIFFEVIKMMPFGDKLGHFVLSALLALSLNIGLSYRRIRLGRRAVLLGSLLAILLMTIDELSQLAFPRRSFDPIDYGAGMIGVLLISQLLQEKTAGSSSIRPSV